MHQICNVCIITEAHDPRFWYVVLQTIPWPVDIRSLMEPGRIGISCQPVEKHNINDSLSRWIIQDMHTVTVPF